MAKKKIQMPKPMTSITSIDGHARVTFDPKFGKSQPFLTYIKGTQHAKFGTAQEARFYCRELGHPFTADDNWK